MYTYLWDNTLGKKVGIFSGGDPREAKASLRQSGGTILHTYIDVGDNAGLEHWFSLLKPHLRSPTRQPYCLRFHCAGKFDSNFPV